MWKRKEKVIFRIFFVFIMKLISPILFPEIEQIIPVVANVSWGFGNQQHNIYISIVSLFSP